MKVELCKVADIPNEGAKTVPFFGRDLSVYLVDVRPRAVLNVCMHLGGQLEMKDDKFVCTRHGAQFNTSDLRCSHGPAKPDSRLMMLPTRVEEAALFYV